MQNICVFDGWLMLGTTDQTVLFFLPVYIYRKALWLRIRKDRGNRGRKNETKVTTFHSPLLFNSSVN